MKKADPYHNSTAKRTIDLLASIIGVVLFMPILIALYFYVSITGEKPLFFIQTRIGKNGKPFKIIKFRTMFVNAEKKLNSLRNKNEADGPIFKIYNDPRYTKLGRVLAHTGLDELPQFINVLKGEMSVVGPRPLPVYEAKEIPNKYGERFLVKPGITSTWVVAGSHKLSFDKWMKSDLDYVHKANALTDLKIVAGTALLVLRSIFEKIILR